MVQVISSDEIKVARKVIEIFNDFPFTNDIKVEKYMQKLKGTIFKDNFISFYLSDFHSVHVLCNNIGNFSKSASIGGSPAYVRYSCGFYPIDKNFNRVMSLYQLNKSTVDEICNYVIPFLITGGKDKSDLPLLIHTFPDLANYLLQL